MPRYRFRDDDSSSASTIIAVIAGAVGGFALGMYVAQRVGGLEGLKSKFAARRSGGGEVPHPFDEGEFDDVETDEVEEDVDEALEERVLEAYRNDPILAERAVDIGSIGEGIIELAGWVETEEESEHAVTLARGVPGVDTVVNRLAVGSDEERFEESARRAARGDAAYSERHWESNTIGTGRRRQGNSDELDRHSSPKKDLEDRWSQTSEAIRQSADEAGSSGNRSARGARGAMKDSGVPRGDHASPEKAD